MQSNGWAINHGCFTTVNVGRVATETGIETTPAHPGRGAAVVADTPATTPAARKAAEAAKPNATLPPVT